MFDEINKWLNQIADEEIQADWQDATDFILCQNEREKGNPYAYCDKDCRWQQGVN